MVRPNPDLEPRRPEQAATALGPDADRRLQQFAAAIDGLLERRRGRPSLLDTRLIPDRPGRSEDGARWGRGVLGALEAGHALDQAIPETAEAENVRHDLYAVMDALRHEVKADLLDLRTEWARVRGELRRFVLGLAREDDPEDVRAVDRALGACGLRPLAQPEPSPVGAALRKALKTLLDGAAAGQVRRDLRRTLDRLGVRSAPREARFILAMKLTERPVVRPDAGDGAEIAEERAFLADPAPGRRPRLPAPLVGSVLLLLAALDVIEAKEAPRSRWRGRSAYNVLRRVAGEERWEPEIRMAMDAVIEGLLDERGIDDLLGVVGRAILRSGSRAVHGLASEAPGAPPDARTKGSSALDASREGGGSVATGGVSSPAPPSAEAGIPADDGRTAAPPTGGDETSALEAASEAGVGRVSSPSAPGKTVAAGGPLPTDSRGGDGTETSEAASRAGLAEASSPGVPRAAVAAGDGKRAPTTTVRGGTGDGSVPILMRSGEVWSATWRGKTHTLVHRLGLEDLQVLLSKPRVPVACADLVRGRLVEEARPEERADKQAVARIRRELADLEGMHSEGAEEQRARLNAALEELVAPGGRLRVMNTERRRIQQTVSKRIRDAVRAIGEASPALAAHLKACLTTGTECCYDPLRVPPAVAKRP